MEQVNICSDFAGKQAVLIKSCFFSFLDYFMPPLFSMGMGGGGGGGGQGI